MSMPSCRPGRYRVPGWATGLVLCLCMASTGLTFAAQPPRVAVVDFTNDVANATWFHGSVGRQLADALGNELSSTGDFTVLEREKIGAVLDEQDLARRGRIQPQTAAATGDITGAHYLIAGEVSAYSEDTSNTGGGVSFAGFHLGGGKSKAYVAIDLRVIDAQTSQVVYTRTVEGRSTDHNVDVGGYVGWGIGADVHHQKKTPVGKAVRAALIEASKYLDCVMVKRDACVARFRNQEQKRRASDADVLDLD